MLTARFLYRISFVGKMSENLKMSAERATRMQELHQADMYSAEH